MGAAVGRVVAEGQGLGRRCRRRRAGASTQGLGQGQRDGAKGQGLEQRDRERG